MSLSQDPAFQVLKQYFVCGVRDISGLPYSGFSESHKPTSVAVNTSNGAGPHNIQLFVLSSDGTVLTCLPGFWNPQDLVGELQLAEDLNRVWINPNLSRAQKDNSFRALQLGARGILKKTLPIKSILECLRSVGRGDVWIESSLSDHMVGSLDRRSTPRLTPREKEIVHPVRE